MPAGAELTLTGSYTMADFPEVYYYQGPEGTQPQLGVRMGSMQGVFIHNFPPLCARGSVTAELQWMLGHEPFAPGHSEVDWQTYRAYVRRQYGLDLPQAVTVQLLADGEPLGAPVTLRGAGGWRYTWPDLPLFDEDGQNIVYGMAEPGAGSGFRTDVYCYANEGGAEDGGYTLLLTNYYVPFDPQAPAGVCAVWADGKPHGSDTVPVELTAAGTPTGHTAALTQSCSFACEFGPLPVLALGIDYSDVFTGESGVAPLVRRQPIAYGAAVGEVPGYTAAVTEEVLTLPYAEEDFAAGPSRAVQVLVGDPARALALQVEDGLLTLTAAAPDPTDLRQQWAAYEGHLYNLFALVWGAQAAFEEDLGWSVGEVWLTKTGPQFRQAGAPGSAGPLCYHDGALCNGDDTLFLALAPGGGCTVAGPGGGCPVRLRALGRRYTVTLTPLPSPTPTPTPAPTPAPTPTSAPAPTPTPGPTPKPGPMPAPLPAPTAKPAPRSIPTSTAVPAASAPPAAGPASPAPVPVPVPAPAPRSTPVPTPAPRSIPATGDRSSPAGWGAALLAAAGGLAWLRRQKKRYTSGAGAWYSKR